MGLYVGTPAAWKDLHPGRYAVESMPQRTQETAVLSLQRHFSESTGTASGDDVM